MGTDDQVGPPCGHEVCHCTTPPGHCVEVHPGGRPDVSHETLPDRVARYLAAEADRDQLVKDLLASGKSKSEVARMLVMGRPTINRILGSRYAYDHGIARYTAPAPKVSHETEVWVSVHCRANFHDQCTSAGNCRCACHEPGPAPREVSHETS